MRYEAGSWTRYRELPDSFAVDFHKPDADEAADDEDDYLPYAVRMAEVHQRAIEALRTAFTEGYQHVIFLHGSSTSGPGMTTSRSVVRKLIRDKEATPYILRSRCIQHYSVFVAAIRPNPDTTGKIKRLKEEAEVAAARANEAAIIESRAKKEWPRLCRQYEEEIVARVLDEDTREKMSSYPEYLMKNEDDYTTRFMKLKDSIHNYKDQIRRNAGIFHVPR